MRLMDDRFLIETGNDDRKYWPRRFKTARGQGVDRYDRTFVVKIRGTSQLFRMRLLTDAAAGARFAGRLARRRRGQGRGAIRRHFPSRR